MPSPRKATIRPEEIAAVMRFAAYPVPGMNALRLIQPFGTNYNGFYSELGMLGHNGWDIKAATGTRAYAVFDGYCIASYTDNTGGKAVELVSQMFQVPGHEGTYRLRVIYYHLLRPMVQGITAGMPDGQPIKAGELVALTDNTGKYTTGSHLHMGLKLDRKTATGWETMDKDNGFFGAIDPEPFWPDLAWNTYPVDTMYGKDRNVGLEIYWRTFKTTNFYQYFRRPPTQREIFGGTYGGWSVVEMFTTAQWLSSPK